MERRDHGWPGEDRARDGGQRVGERADGVGQGPAGAQGGPQGGLFGAYARCQSAGEDECCRGQDTAEGGDVRNIYKVGLNTSRLLMVLGDIVCGWLLLRGAEVALAKLGGEVSEKDGKKWLTASKIEKT